MQTNTTEMRLFAVLGVILLGLIFWQLTISAPPAVAGDDRTIVVSGTGKVKAAPDAAEVSLGFTTRGETAIEAEAEGAEAISAVIDRLVELGVERNRIETTGVYLYPEYRYGTYLEPGETTLDGYRFNTTLTFVTTDVAGVGSLIDAATAAGANQIQGVQFMLQDPAAHRRAAYDLAVEDALAQARATAEKLGDQLGAVKHVSLVSSGNIYPPMMATDMALESARGAGLSVEPGELEINAQVQVEVLLR